MEEYLRKLSAYVAEHPPDFHSDGGDTILDALFWTYCENAGADSEAVQRGYSETQGVYGTVSMDNNLVATHDPAAADANHVFTLENGMLKVEIPNSAGNGTDYELVDGVLSVNPGFTGAITAEYVFTTSPTREIDFEYDHNGLRTQKKVVENGITTIYDYTLHGKLITHLTKRVVDLEGVETSEELHFFYDAYKMLTLISTSNEIYRVAQNVNGDVVGLVDKNNVLIVEYRYDAWGKVFTVDSSGCAIGQLNPFMYRNYMFDSDSGLYYLDERYYDPVESRFINSDWVFIFAITEVSDLLKNNLFAYCKNNPIMEYDPLGIWSWKTVFKVALTAVAVVGAVAIAAASGGAAVAAAATVTMGCSTIGGMLSAKAAGGKYEDGALAGACGGLMSLATGTMIVNPMAGRIASSVVYDLAYEKLATGAVDPEDYALTAIDVGLDIATSGLYYDSASYFIEESAQNLARGALDNITDVAQTTILYNNIPKGASNGTSNSKATVPAGGYQRYGGVRNMQMEIAFMQG